MIRQKGVRVNDAVVEDEMTRLRAADVDAGRIALQVGKKKHHHLMIV